MGGILRFTILLYLLTDLSAQTITFKKTILPLDSKANSVKQTTDNKYIVGGTTAELDAIVLKLNEFGRVEWKRIIGSSRTIEVESDDEGNIIAAVIDSGRLKIVKLDKQGKERWTKFYGSCSYIAIKYKSSSKFITAKALSGQLIISEIDANGDELWNKTYYINNSRRPVIKLIKGNGFAVGTSKFTTNPGWLIRFNDQGDSLWSKTIPGYSFIPSSTGFLVPDGVTLNVLDDMGNNILKKPFNGIYSYSCESIDGGYAFGGSNLVKLNTDNEIEWSFGNFSSAPSINSTSDNGFVLVNGNSIFKTDENGICKWIDLNDYTTLPAGKTHKLHWYSESVKIINLEYSTDKGKNWNTIVNNYPDSSEYLWSVPEIISSNVILKITDYENPLISDSVIIRIGYNLAHDFIAVNEIKMFLSNNGIGSHDIISDNSGLLWPGGQGAVLPVIFTDGLVWGGLVDGQVRVNGSTYRTGLLPGKILEDGKGDDPNKIDYNLWRIRKDWETLPEGVDRNRNEYNYTNWPGEMGAPYEDVNNDGKFTRGIDKPMILGDETFWFAANDTDTSASRFLYGSDPVGIEMQCTVYGYNRTDELADVIFKHYKLTNHSGKVIEKMCLGCWADPDLGFASDDFVGCDTNLALGFVYNGDNFDDKLFNDSGYGNNPPAAGYKLLDGLQATGFIFYIGASAFWQDPTLGRFDGSIQMYNYLNAKLYDGTDIRNPITDQVTRYWLSGDPVAGLGWYEGEGWPGGEKPNDMRMMLVTGPTQFNPQDTLELTIAIILARGTDNINSVKELKRKAGLVQEFYDTGNMTGSIESPAIVKEYELKQNYPNPFNPSTTIRYSLPEKTNVELKVFDVLGKEIVTLVDEEKHPGSYKVNFKADKLSSGVYYCQLKTKNFISTRKMLLVK